MKELTAKQELFVKEYLVDGNATQSAIRAGYSEKTAYSIGNENLRKPEIQKAIDEEKLKRNQRLHINQDYVLQRLIDIDQLDVAEILDENGVLLPVSQWSKKWRQSIASFEIFETDEEGRVTKIKFPDKLKNLDLLGKHVQVSAWASTTKVDVTTNGKDYSPPIFNITGVEPNGSSS